MQQEDPKSISTDSRMPAVMLHEPAPAYTISKVHDIFHTAVIEDVVCNKIISISVSMSCCVTVAKDLMPIEGANKAGPA